jgi:hypothetical protein
MINFKCVRAYARLWKCTQCQTLLFSPLKFPQSRQLAVTIPITYICLNSTSPTTTEVQPGISHWRPKKNRKTRRASAPLQQTKIEGQKMKSN